MLLWLVVYYVISELIICPPRHYGHVRVGSVHVIYIVVTCGGLIFFRVLITYEA